MPLSKLSILLVALPISVLGLTSNVAAVEDPHSFSNPDDVLVTHVALDLEVDFGLHRLEGTALLNIDNKTGTRELLLDTRDLEILNVEISKDTNNWRVAFFELGDEKPFMGKPLQVGITKRTKFVRIHYRTAPEASGLQWLSPQQTAGGKLPYLFSQAQSNHARSFIPLQDTPQVRITYSATFRVPDNMRVVMSATNDPEAPLDGVFEFDMPQAVPAYLIAFAVGNITFKSMGDRTGVYTEPEILEAAAKEFEDTEAMLEAIEPVYGPYRWDRYDLLILPPSFPFGGMENPRLSFITPSVIAGDKSLVSLIAHELAHSWSGNLVTNSTWHDPWLNEGFTTYLTYRIMEMVYGKKRERMEASLGYAELLEDLEELEAPEERLAIDLVGRDPDDGFTQVPYEKGALFLFELEHRVGRENFDQFLRTYFDHFAFQSISTNDFLAYLDETLLEEYGDELDRERILEWIHQPGIPEGVPIPESIPIYKSKKLFAIMILGLVIFVGYTTVDNAINLGRSEGYMPDQPIKFSHELHAGLNSIDCQFCHSGARVGKHSNIPSSNVCMNCHKGIREAKVFGKYGRKEIAKIYASIGFNPTNLSYFEDYENMPKEEVATIFTEWLKGDQNHDHSKSDINEVLDQIQKPIEWVRIHNLPDHVYFNHSQHVVVAGIECQTCQLNLTGNKNKL